MALESVIKKEEDILTWEWETWALILALVTLSRSPSPLQVSAFLQEFA